MDADSSNGSIPGRERKPVSGMPAEAPVAVVL